MPSQSYNAKAEALFVTFDKRYEQAYSQAAGFENQIATIVQSAGLENRYTWMDQSPSLREWVGAREIQSMTSNLYSLVNKKFERTLTLDVDALEDDMLSVFAGMPEELGMQAKIWPSQQLAAAVEAGETALSFDSAAYFSTSHPLDPSGTLTTAVQSNLYSAGGGTLTAPNLSAARAQMKSFKGRNSAPLGIGSMGKLLLMVPNELESAAMQIANAEFIAPSAAFGGNASGGYQTNVLRGSVDVLVNPWLTNATAWYLLDTSRPIKPFVWQLRKAPKFIWKNKPEDDNVFFENRLLYGVDSRGAAGYGPHFLALKGRP